jgi:thiol:disulfide interchange protein DsbD
MERSVFPVPEVAAQLAQFHLVRADVTANSTADKALMNEYGLFGPPSMVFFDEEGRELTEIRVQGEIGASALAAHLAAVLAHLSSHNVEKTSSNVGDTASI